ncbi:6-phosphogluconate phosphatase [Thalassocella blandensis]|nr:6-phosphogluconate phosphatase [Thalassocella blandensis]
MLVIFDCDGVLVDSEELAAQIFSETLQEVGLNLTAEECFTLFKGHTLPACLNKITQELKFDLPDDFKDLLDLRTREGFSKNLQAVKGVQSLLQFLQQHNVNFCVASNGGKQKIDHSLAITGLDAYFSQRFSAEDVGQGKPSPELFLYAAEVVGVPPEFCFVIEDSPTGFAAAQAAGMKLLRYLPLETFSEQDRVFTRMQQIQEFFEREIKSV